MLSIFFAHIMAVLKLITQKNMKYTIVLIIILVLSACGFNPSKQNENHTKTLTASDTVYDNDKTDSPALMIVSVAPNYPKKAYNNMLEGFTEMEVVINEGGSVINAEVIASEPKGLFDYEAIRAIKKYKFKPAIINNKAVLTKMTQKIEFKIKRSK